MAPATPISNPIARVAIILAGLGAAAPAMADEVQGVAIYGFVAPRCWVAAPTAMPTETGLAAIRPRAICNEARPVLLTKSRSIAADGTLVKPVSGSPDAAVTAASLSPRAALEIVVTPLL